jgi:mRNA interferase HicA
VFDTVDVKGSEFRRKVKRFADRKGLAYRWVAARGVGSHGTLYIGSRMTVVKDLKKELGSGLFRSMCNDLDINPREL